MSKPKHTPDGMEEAQAPAAPDLKRGHPRDGLQTQHGSTGQQRAQQRADLAQHGVQIHVQSRNVDRGGSGKK